MALTAEQQDHISNVGNIAERLVNDYLLLVQLDAQWGGADDYANGITQEEIDQIGSFAAVNLQKANVTEVNYILSGLLALMTPRITHLIKLKSLP